MIRNKCLHKVINQILSILTVYATHAHTELSGEIWLPAFMHPVKQLFYAPVNDYTGSYGTGQ